jgi:MFS family permease
MELSADRAAALRRNLPILRAIRLFFWAHFFGAVLVPFFTEWGGLKMSQVFQLNAWFMACGFLLEGPTGAVADRFGRRVSIGLGGVVAAAGALVYASAPHWTRFVAGEFLMAAAYALQSGADEALAFDSLDALGEKGSAARRLAGLEAWKLAGINLSTLAGGWIAARWGLRAPMLAFAAPAAVVAFLALFLTEAPRRGARRKGYWAVMDGAFRSFWGNKPLRGLAVEVAITNALAWGVIWLFQPALKARGLGIGYFGAVHAAACLGQIGFLANVDRLERFVGSRRRLLNGSTIVAGLALVTMAWAESLWIVIPAIVAAFAFSLPRVVVYGARLNAFIDSEHRATLLSVVSMTRTVAIIVVNPLTGWASDRSLGGALTFLGVGLALAPLLSSLPASYFDGDASRGELQ